MIPPGPPLANRQPNLQPTPGETPIMHPNPTPHPILESTPTTQLRAHHPRAWQRLLELLPTAPPEPLPATLGEMLDQLPRDRNTLLYQLNEAAGLVGRFLPLLPPAERDRLTRDLPDPHQIPPTELARLLHALPRKAVLSLDANPILEEGRDPFQAIMEHLARLPDPGVLLLRIPFKPLPLFQVLARRGFGHLVAPEGNGWLVAIRRTTPESPTTTPESPATTPAPGQGCPAELDVRGLPPPQPMTRILERLPHLLPGERLEVLLERVPHLLFPRLRELHLTWELGQEGDGVVHLTIRRPLPDGSREPLSGNQSAY